MDNNEFKKLIFGTYSIKEIDNGYLFFDRLDKKQHNVITKDCYIGSVVNCSITIEFISIDATRFSFNYRKIDIPTEFDTIDYLVDGILVESYPLRSLAKEGMLSYEIPKGNHKITIFLPSDGAMDLKDFDIDGTYNYVTKGKKVLVMGDSITQGFGPYITSKTFVNEIINRTDLNTLNQGVGGYYYDEEFLTKLENFEKPDLIIIAMGTNQYQKDNRYEKVESFYMKFDELYHNIPTITITPIWRENCKEYQLQLEEYCNYISKVCSKYDYIKVSNGYDYIPHNNNYYRDGLHPNVKGMKLYANALLKEIKKLGL